MLAKSTTDANVAAALIDKAADLKSRLDEPGVQIALRLGLDVEDHKKLFKRFQRLSAKPTGGEVSTGLGLSIAKKYTEVMNGSLICISEKGKGATFTVELPLSSHVI